MTAPVVNPQVIPTPYVPELYPSGLSPRPAVTPPPSTPPAYIPEPPPPVANETELSGRGERLKQEIEAVRQKPQGPAPALGEAPPAQRPTVLIFRNGQRKEVGNYAIAGQTLWIFDEEKSTQVALQEIDINATQKENRARGLRFSPPTQ